jgi:hypothetical protein
MNRKHFSILFSLLAVILPNSTDMTQKSKSPENQIITEWILSNLTERPQNGVKIEGKPGILECKYGKAVTFDGSSNAIFLDSMPLTGLDQFTIELIFQPASGGNFEQRFMHLGEVQGDRVLLELRSTEAGWYFDGFIKVGEQNCTLIDPQLLHPLDQWYHVAYVVDKGKLATFVNGKKELEGNIVMAPVKGDKTSIGVRQNGVSWFKGAIYKIRITNEALTPGNFMSY